MTNQSSHDLEDLMAVVDGRPELAEPSCNILRMPNKTYAHSRQKGRPKKINEGLCTLTGVNAQEEPRETDRLFCALRLLIFLYFGTGPLAATTRNRSQRCVSTAGAWVADRLLRPCSELFRMQIVSLILRGLVFFYMDAMGVGAGVLANAVTCQETFTLGLSVRMVNWLWLTSEATMV